MWNTALSESQRLLVLGFEEYCINMWTIDRVSLLESLVSDQIAVLADFNQVIQYIKPLVFLQIHILCCNEICEINVSMKSKPKM